MTFIIKSSWVPYICIRYTAPPWLRHASLNLANETFQLLHCKLHLLVEKGRSFHSRTHFHLSAFQLRRERGGIFNQARTKIPKEVHSHVCSSTSMKSSNKEHLPIILKYTWTPLLLSVTNKLAKSVLSWVMLTWRGGSQKIYKWWRGGQYIQDRESKYWVRCASSNFLHFSPWEFRNRKTVKRGWWLFKSLLHIVWTNENRAKRDFLKLQKLSNLWGFLWCSQKLICQ